MTATFKTSVKASPYLFVLMSACLMTLSQVHVFNGVMLPPGLFGHLAWLAVVPLLAAVSVQEKYSKKFKLAWIGLFLYFSFSLYWITVAMSIYGGLPWSVSSLVLFLLAAFLSLLLSFGICCGFYFERHLKIPLVLALPTAWVGMEWIRTFIFSGFPWSNLAEGQMLCNLPLVQVADLFGENGVTWVLIFSNIVLLKVLFHEPLKKLLPIWVALLIGVFSYGCFRLHEYRNYTATVSSTSGPESSVLHIAALQANIPQDQKWDRAFREKILKTYQDLGDEALKKNANLLVWPEAALPFTLPESFMEIPQPQYEYLFGSRPAHHLFGAVLDDGRYIYNSALLLSPTGERLGTYRKSHLVPLGEYIPYKDSILFFLDKVVPAIGDFKPGREIKPLSFQANVNGPIWKLGVLVCYEDIFPEISRRFAKENAQVLINITNDAWYGHTSGPFQHLSISSYRAVENRLPMIRATNTGVSAVVSPAGKRLEVLPWFKSGILELEISPAVPQRSLYTRGGWLFNPLAFAFILGCWGFTLFKNRRIVSRAFFRYTSGHGK